MKKIRLATRSKLSALITALALVAVSLCACDSGPASLAADKRPIPAELPRTERTAHRDLPLQGAYNFRDLGGYPTADGRTTRWGLVYRSGQLSDLSGEDQRYLQRLHLKRVVDFRSQGEVSADPDQLGDDSSAQLVLMPINVTGANPQLMEEKIRSGNVTAEEMERFMVDANHTFVEKYTALYSRWLHSFLNAGNLPAVFHCSAGKDRTGFGAAILLRTLGVDQKIVMQDYMASNQYNAEYIEHMLLMVKIGSFFRADTDALKPVFTVEPKYLQAAFDTIDKEYGSFENYLRDGLKITPEQQQQLINTLTE